MARLPTRPRKNLPSTFRNRTRHGGDANAGLGRFVRSATCRKTSVVVYPSPLQDFARDLAIELFHDLRLVHARPTSVPKRKPFGIMRA